MNVVLYARVSTDEQAEKHSIPATVKKIFSNICRAVKTLESMSVHVLDIVLNTNMYAC